jgi:Uma2 family endonuclease
MATVVAPAQQYMLLDNVSWQSYETLLRELEGQNLRLTYDGGSLEIMTISHGHGNYGTLMGDFVRLLTVELDIPIHSGGNTTFRLEAERRGLEPDECYWVQHESQMRAKKEFDIDVDPPPDLAIEIDIFSSSLPRMAIYASLRVGEVWRYDGQSLQVFVLTAGGKYREQRRSTVFPFLPMNELLRFLEASNSQDETSLMREFVAWLRAEVRPRYERISKKPGRGNGKSKGKA